MVLVNLISTFVGALYALLSHVYCGEWDITKVTGKLNQCVLLFAWEQFQMFMDQHLGSN